MAVRRRPANMGVESHPFVQHRRQVMRVFVSIIIASAIASAASAQVPDFTPQTPLIGALLHNDAAEAERLLKGGADPNEGVFFGLPPVILAAVRQNPELVR